MRSECHAFQAGDLEMQQQSYNTETEHINSDTLVLSSVEGVPPARQSDASLSIYRAGNSLSNTNKQQITAIFTRSGRLSLEVTAHPRSYARIKTIRTIPTPKSSRIYCEGPMQAPIQKPYPLSRRGGFIHASAIPLYLTPSTESFVLCCVASAAQHGDHDTWRRPPCQSRSLCTIPFAR